MVSSSPTVGGFAGYFRLGTSPMATNIPPATNSARPVGFCAVRRRSSTARSAVRGADGIAGAMTHAPTCLSFDIVPEMTGPVPNLVACWWWLRLEWLVPPPVGALASGPGAGCHCGRGKVRRTGERSSTQWLAGTVGDDEIACGSGDGDNTSMVQPVVIRAHQYQVEQLGRAAVLPVPDVVCVQTAGSSTTGNRARSVAVLQCAAKPPVDLAGRSARADDLAVTFEPHFTRWHHRSGIGVRTPRAADPDAAPRRAAQRQRAPPRWCDARAAGGPPRCPTLSPPGA